MKLQLRDVLTLVVTTLLAAWYAALVIGVPLPGPRKLISERFPCENCRCGCTSAEFCWRDCCCHTAAERLAWAEREGVEPPPFVRAKLAREAPRAACCAKRTTTTAVRSCCASRSPSCGATAAQRPRESMSVVGWRALTCQGQGLQWTSAVPAMPLTPFDMPDRPALVAWLSPLPAPTLLGVCYAPVVPPPERHPA